VTHEVFNVGTRKQTSLKELCELLLRLTNSPLRPEHREARKVANVQARRAATEKAATFLGFEANVSLAEGLEELIRWRESTKAVPAAVEAL
jgi:UDP-glucose 4-epimerase